MVAFFLGNYDMNTGLILMMLCMGTYGFFFLVLAYHYNQFSQNLFESMQQLKYLIESIDIIDNNQVLFVDYKRFRAIHAQKLLLHEINQFKGFDGNGFFTLGKPLLTSILASFVTYLIVLILICTFTCLL